MHLYSDKCFMQVCGLKLNNNGNDNNNGNSDCTEKVNEKVNGNGNGNDKGNDKGNCNDNENGNNNDNSSNNDKCNLKKYDMKNVLFVVLIALIGCTTQAQEKKNKNAKYEIEVNGNCEMCKKRIEKAALSVDGVKSATWSIESHKLTILLNEQKASIKQVENAVAKVGHDTENSKATDEAYTKLHQCCAYERK